MKKAIIYLHGFNSASLGLDGKLLIGRSKLAILQGFCTERGIRLLTPNIDYRDFASLVEDLLFEWNQLLDQGYDTVFMGSSMGGFASEYLALKTGAKAIMVNPAISPCELLPQFIGVTENYETGQPYDWTQSHCDQYQYYQQALANHRQPLDRLVLLDMADELIDSATTRARYQDKADVLCFEGGSHSFEHLQAALPAIERVLFG